MPDTAEAVTSEVYQARREGRLDAALVLYAEAATLYRAQADLLRLAHAVRHIGDIHVQQGTLAQAEPFYREALAIYRAHPEGSTLDFANALRAAAVFRARVGDQTTAASLWAEAKPLYELCGIQPGIDEATRQVALLANSVSSDSKGAITN
jgi:tetratricopeptide (TPR) repeat protein